MLITNIVCELVRRIFGDDIEVINGIMLWVLLTENSLSLSSLNTEMVLLGLDFFELENFKYDYPPLVVDY